MSGNEIFKAVEQMPFDQRVEFVLAICGNDAELRAKLLQQIKVSDSPPAKSESVADESDVVTVWSDAIAPDRTSPAIDGSSTRNTLQPRQRIDLPLQTTSTSR